MWILNEIFFVFPNKTLMVIRKNISHECMNTWMRWMWQVTLRWPCVERFLSSTWMHVISSLLPTTTTPLYFHFKACDFSFILNQRTIHPFIYARDWRMNVKKRQQQIGSKTWVTEIFQEIFQSYLKMNSVYVAGTCYWLLEAGAFERRD